MMFLRCNCCSSCKIFEDDFNRANNASPGSNWTENSGTGSISGNAYVFTSAGQISCNVSHPDGDSTMVVEATFRRTQAGLIQISGAWVNATNYYSAAFNVNGASGQVLVTRTSGGSTTTLASVTTTLNINTTYTGKLCITENGNITAYLNGVAKATAYSQSPTGIQAALRTFDSGTVTFDDFKLHKNYHSEGASSCSECGGEGEVVITDCNQCCSFVESTRSFTVDLGAGGWTDQNCNACDTIGGEYVLTFFPVLCSWRYSIPNFCTAGCTGMSSRALGWAVTAQLRFRTVEGVMKCYWRVVVGFSFALTDDDNPGADCDNYAEYESELNDPNVLDCASTGPWVLPKIADTMGTGAFCNGSLPDTVELTLNP